MVIEFEKAGTVPSRVVIELSLPTNTCTEVARSVLPERATPTWPDEVSNWLEAIREVCVARTY